MIAIISPAKLLDEKKNHLSVPFTLPEFIPQAETLVKKLQKVSAKKLSELMDISTDLGELNKQRYHNWHLPFTNENAKQAILIFKGDVYRGLNADDFTPNDFEYAQLHLRILSGLYGVLKPLDLIQPYRLMMGTPFSPSSVVKNLYVYWGNTLATKLSTELKKDEVLLNLASSEYFKAVPVKALNRPVITCQFLDLKNGKYQAIQTYTKLARGYMARFIIKNKINKVSDVKAFDSNGFVFNKALSTADLFTFTRDVLPVVLSKR